MGDPKVPRARRSWHSYAPGGPGRATGTRSSPATRAAWPLPSSWQRFGAPTETVWVFCYDGGVCRGKRPRRGRPRANETASRKRRLKEKARPVMRRKGPQSRDGIAHPLGQTMPSVWQIKECPNLQHHATKSYSPRRNRCHTRASRPITTPPRNTYGSVLNSAASHSLVRGDG